MGTYREHPCVCLVFLAVPIVFILLLVAGPDGTWRMGTQRKGLPRLEERLKELQNEEIEKIKKNLLSVVGKEEKNGGYQLNKIGNAITYAVGRHDWYEQQRQTIFTNVVAIAGLLLTAMGFAVGEGAIEQKYLCIIVSTAAVLIIALFWIVNLYDAELDQDRPYRMVSDVRYWFFRYSLPQRGKRAGEADASTLATEVIKEREKYFDRVLANSALEISVREDLEQLFILHVLQRYKQQSLKAMRWVLSSLVRILGLQAAIFFIILWMS
jgi:hypothetical protein